MANCHSSKAKAHKFSKKIKSAGDREEKEPNKGIDERSSAKSPKPSSSNGHLIIPERRRRRRRRKCRVLKEVEGQGGREGEPQKERRLSISCRS